MDNQLNANDIIEVPGFNGFWVVSQVTNSGIVVLEKP